MIKVWFGGGDLIAEPRPYLIPGYHGVRECLLQGQVGIREIWLARGKATAREKEIIQLAEKRRVPVRFKGPRELTRLLPDVAHQGFVAVAKKFVYADFDRMVLDAMKGPGRALLLVADHITDEGNLGAIIRTAAFFGAHGLIIPKDRSASVTPAVLKRSAGACVYLPVAKVVNLARALEFLEKRGFWVIGTAGDGGESVDLFDWDRDLVLVMGSEERGLSHAVRRRCHHIAGIPRWGKVESLNVAVAAGVFLWEMKKHEGLKT